MFYLIYRKSHTLPKHLVNNAASVRNEFQVISLFENQLTDS